MDLTNWLASHGLERLAAPLHDAGVDLELLPELSQADLAEVGLNLGDRKRLLKAIATLGQSALQGSNSAAQTALTPPSQPAETAAAHTPERRQLTVMFCDLVGSTALSRRLDPEDLRQLMQRYHQRVTLAVQPSGGHIAQYLGDGVLVYFGYPSAQEDDAIRAVRAALAILRALDDAQEPANERLQTRIGIATGVVVIDEIGSGTRAAEMSAGGETPNLAARLQSCAQPGEVVIADSTRRLLGASFELTALQPIALKGFEAPVAAWQVMGERRAESRFHAQRAQDLSRFIGRDSEVTLLLERWSMACEGDGQLVLISGEAGIGKSRVTLALRERLQGEQLSPWLWQCSPHLASSALHPVTQQLEHAARFLADESASARSGRLTRHLTQMGMPAEQRGWVSRLMNLPTDFTPPDPIEPGRAKTQTLQALLAGIRAAARTHPVLLLVEDAHWIDPTSEELLTLCIEQLRHDRVLIVVTARPEYSPPWGKTAHLCHLSLSRLGQRQSAALIAEVIEGKTLPAALIAEIVRKTDGIPLFVEELTKTVIESGMLTPTESGYELRGALQSLAIPATLQDSLTARLDRLAPAKVVAQAGAAIGREFSHRLLAAVLPGLPPASLRAALDDLIRAELVLPSADHADTRYTFKHALVRDTAYNSMLKSQRVLQHARIAEALERLESDACSQRPEWLAHHHEQAGHLQRAVELWTAAGERATARSALREAVVHYEAALAAHERLAPQERPLRDELDIRLKLAACLAYVEGFVSGAMANHYQRARELSLTMNDLERYATVSFASLTSSYAQGRYSEAFTIARDLAAMKLDLEGPSPIAFFAQSATLFSNLMMGRFSETLAQLPLVIDRPDLPRALHAALRPAGIIQDIGNRQLAARALAYAGLLNDGYRVAAAGVQFATAENHAFSVVRARLHLHIDTALRGDWVELERLTRDDIRLADEIGDMARVGTAYHGLGIALIATGRLAEGITNLHEGHRLYSAHTGRMGVSELAARSAGALVRAGQFEEAAEFVLIGRRVQAESEERLQQAELLRLDACLHLAKGRATQAQAGFLEALQVAQEQGARLFALRAARDLARLLNSQDQGARGRALLEPIWRSFTQGLDYLDLIEAKATLATLP